MTIQTLLSNIIFNGFSSIDEAKVRLAITDLYNVSTTARTMLDKVTPQQQLTINFLSGHFQAHGAGAYQLEIDPNYNDKLFFVTPTGKAIQYPLSVNIAHELEHAINGTLENPRTDINLAGPTVIATNVIHDEMGIARRLTYEGAADITDTSVQINKDYTNGTVIDVAIVMLTSEGTTNYDVISANHITDSRDLIIGNNSTNFIYTGDGDDFIYGYGGNDNLEGGNGNDFLDGGDGIDTAEYDGSVVSIEIRVSSPNSSNLGTIEIDAGSGNIDHIKNIERINLSALDNTITVTRSSNIHYPNNIMIDGGAGEDTLIYAGASVITAIKEISSVSESDSQNKFRMELIGNIENIKGTSGNDTLGIVLLPTTKVQKIHAGDGDDEVSVVGSLVAFKPTIYLENGDDTLVAAPRGSIVYGGAGADKFELGSDYLIADADTSDTITYGGRTIHGGINFNTQESPWAKGIYGSIIPAPARGSAAANDNPANDNYIDINIYAKVG
ncbi:MAG: hypothetical protein R3D71_10040 [Rickettsiales bacterium]